MNYIKRTLWTWRHHWRNLMTTFITWYGGLWLLVESLGAFDKDNFGFLQAPKYLTFAIVASAVASLITNIFRNSIAFKLPHSNTTIEVKFADFFSQDGLKVVPVNEYFDGELGQHVAASTLHGQFIQRHFGGQAQAFYAALAEKMDAIAGQKIGRDSGRPIRYPIGTTVWMGINATSYLLLASARTNIRTLKAESDLPTFMRAMEQLWEASRVKANGEKVVVPLIGTGLAGIGLAPQQMLDLLLLSFVEANKSKEVCQHLTVVLYPPRYKEFDLTRIEKMGVQRGI